VLLTRVITAVALLLVVVGMLFLATPAIWSLFVLAIALVSCWEWSRMCNFSPGAKMAYLAASFAIGAFLWLLYMRLVPGNFVAAALTGFIIATLFWLVGAPFWLAQKMRPSPSTCAVAGWIVVWPGWLAFVVLRDTSPWLLLALAALVWVADIAAYFAGKRFGKRKLAPAVSPGKTWEGVYGALAGVVVYGAALAWIAHARATPLTPIFDDGATVIVLVAMLALTAVSVVGDLFESFIKREAGAKDSGRLFGAHGGALDRLDGVLFAAVAGYYIWAAYV
jgi:phosphatidate cytidylyltransferase